MELELLKLIQSVKTPLLDTVFQYITMMGEEVFIMLFASLVFWCVDRNTGYRMFFVYLTGACLNEGLKQLFHTARPIGQPELRSLRTETAPGFSFPSGHTQGTTSLWATAMLRHGRAWMYIAGISAIVLVGYSRMYLGVHWPVDVVGGIVIGVVWALAADRIFSVIEKIKKRYILLTVFGTVCAAIFLISNETSFKVAAVILGFTIGYTIESEYIKFDARAGLLTQILKIVTGFSGLLLIKFGLKALFPNAIVFDMLRYGLIALWVVAGAPFLFRKITTKIISRENKKLLTFDAGE